MSALGSSNSVSLVSSGSDLSSLGLLILTDFAPAALLLLRVIILNSSFPLALILFRPLSSPNRTRVAKSSFLSWTFLLRRLHVHILNPKYELQTLYLVDRHYCSWVPPVALWPHGPLVSLLVPVTFKRSLILSQFFVLLLRVVRILRAQHSLLPAI